MPGYSYIDCLLSGNDPLELFKVELVDDDSPKPIGSVTRRPG
jgi:hypothetical protein